MKSRWKPKMWSQAKNNMNETLSITFTPISKSDKESFWFVDVLTQTCGSSIMYKNSNRNRPNKTLTIKSIAKFTLRRCSSQLQKHSYSHWILKNSLDKIRNSSFRLLKHKLELINQERFSRHRSQCSRSLFRMMCPATLNRISYTFTMGTDNPRFST